jgi:hypothetical protein
MDVLLQWRQSRTTAEARIDCRERFDQCRCRAISRAVKLPDVKAAVRQRPSSAALFQ